MTGRRSQNDEIGLARSHVAARVAAERATSLAPRKKLIVPALLMIAVLLTPLSISVTERLVLCAVTAGAVLVGVAGARAVPSEWASVVDSCVHIAVSLAIVAVAPELFAAVAVYITSSVIVNVAIQTSPRGLYVGGAAASGLFALGLVKDRPAWLYAAAVLAIFAFADRSWIRDWKKQQVETNQRFDDLIDSTNMFFWEAEATSARIVSIAGNTFGTLGYHPDEMINMPWGDFIAPQEWDRVRSRFAKGVAPDERIDGMMAFRHRDGRIVMLRQLVRAKHNGNLEGSSSDITALHEASETLRHQAEHDMLTGLPNRLKFQLELDRLFADGTHEQNVGLALMDLDGFKEINDTLGHNIGDQVLQRLADRLRNSLGSATVTARIGGDEFAFLVVDDENGVDAETMNRFASELMALVDGPVQIGELKLTLRSSAGIAISPDHGDNGELLLQRADIALYQAKDSVEAYAIYAPTPGAHSVERLELSARMGDALANDEFELWFQPKVDLKTGELIGAEGLARWRHPDLGVLAPERFMPLLGVAGDYQTFTNQMIRLGIDFLAACQLAGHPMSVAVNLGSVSFLDTDLPGRIEAMLEVHHVNPDSLILEVTEEEVLLDRDTSFDVFAALERLGLRLSIDDFGTGYSSLARLRSLRIDELKIDRSFVGGLSEDPEDRAIVRTIIELAKQLNQETVAEGIETQAQLQLLQSLGCDVGQGFLFDKPMTFGDFFERLAAGELNYSKMSNFGIGAGWLPQGSTELQALASKHDGITVSSAATDIRACLITDRQRLDFMTALIDMIPVGIWVKDSEARFVRGNAALRSALGIDNQSQLLNRQDTDLHPVRQEATRFAAEDDHVLGTGETYVSQFERQTRADGSVDAIFTSKYPVRNADDQVIGLVGFYTRAQIDPESDAADSAAEGSEVTNKQ